MFRTAIVITLALTAVSCGGGSPTSKALAGTCGRFAHRVKTGATAALLKEGLTRPLHGLTIDWSTATTAVGGGMNQHDAKHVANSLNVAFGPNNSPIATANLVFLLYQDGNIKFQGCLNLSGRPGDNASMPLLDPEPSKPAAVLIDTVFTENRMYQNTNSLELSPISAGGVGPVFFPKAGSANKLPLMPPIVNPNFAGSSVVLDQLAQAPCAQPKAVCLDAGYFTFSVKKSDMDTLDPNYALGKIINVDGAAHRSVAVHLPSAPAFNLAVAISSTPSGAYSNQAWNIT